MEELVTIPIHLAKTRPAMKFGLPIELLVAFVVVTTEIGIVAGAFYMLPMIPVFWGMTLLVRKDYNAPRVFFLWLRSGALDFETSTWGGTSVDPYPLSDKGYRGIPPDA